MTKFFSLLMLVCLIQMANAQEWNSNGDNTTTGNVTSSGNYVVGNNGYNNAPFKVDNNYNYTFGSARLGHFTSSNSSTGVFNFISVGKNSESPGNSMTIGFTYAGDNSSDNTAGIGFWGNDNVIKIKRNNSTEFKGGISTNGNALINGNLWAKEIRVETENPWPDFVFEDSYYLLPLEKVQQFISENGHLKDIPDASEISEEGVNLGEMNTKLLQKVEELTLYMIDLNKRVKLLENENEKLKKENSVLSIKK
jgi:hypothetical protein